jgi:hypothetical protein
MTNGQPTTTMQHTITPEKHAEWCKRKDELYHKILELACIDDDINLSENKMENLEYAMEIILNHGTYFENAQAIRMYSQYFNLHELLTI